ncbi:SPOR domain-containing protein [Providencia rettgeri]|uniref:SPOR domain-containing protein n=1 Tax=Providencia sp. PROV148 TaxID=2949858 RepID=UPI00234B76A0|nr:SPOR domain-containing protein [Providencia sp. PROV148]EJD6474967.1 SPOR domain-containing protein [Providencia rettgeri]ELR5066601.1 SPOR domain-containing protein [Providencia rettgeri]ELR5163574.1 SPOR domain-containing protein [Providencia rettgeri]
MASKFQNRLAGAIVLVAVGVIVLPALLDGDKKYNENEFAAIPIIPKPGDEEDIEAIAPIVSTTTTASSEGASEAMLSEAITQQQNEQVETRPSTTTPAPSVVEPVKPEPKPEPKPQPQGKAFVVQVIALNNASKVEEIVAKLRLSGYQVYTVPAKPVNNKLTRIYVGPEASRQRLEAALPELNKITGTKGIIQSYKP